MEEILTIYTTQVDQFGKGTRRVMSRSNHAWRCPVRAAWYLVKRHKALNIEANSLLCKIDSMQNLHVLDLVKAIKHAAELADEDPNKYGSHSLRSGGATALFNAGFVSLAAKRFGRWSSDAVERYKCISGVLTMRISRAMLTPVSQQE
ncbi:hypothetical protein PHMEG_00024683 [Phytophthora megakarya]|uniref:Tyr recombinase domain-containing protein n=1 Tax=Phytophthora megakarya TaxID=4795 RepID=A0A225VE25_9STRA|nr:hypothetical protein PHMEG_00024683 [Phytophthora megakarya]